MHCSKQPIAASAHSDDGPDNDYRHVPLTISPPTEMGLSYKSFGLTLIGDDHRDGPDLAGRAHFLHVLRRSPSVGRGAAGPVVASFGTETALQAGSSKVPSA